MKKIIVSALTAALACAAVLGGTGAVGVGASTGTETQFHKGELLTYGSYNGVDLQWEIVAATEGYATLFLHDVLRDGTDQQENMLLKQFAPDQEQSGANVWAQSPLFTFLNTDFYEQAFTEEQRQAIVQVDNYYPGIVTETSMRQGEEISNPTAGRAYVFIPSYGELVSWYDSLEERSLGNSALWWWTRSPVTGAAAIQTVWYAHEGGENRAIVEYYLSVRPVIVLNTQTAGIEVVSSLTVNTQAGATVSVLQGTQQVATQQADDQGKATFPTLTMGNYSVVVSMDGYVERTLPLNLTAEPASMDVQLSLITYTVTGETEGGAIVQLLKDQDVVAQVTADESGAFELTVVPGEYSIQVRKLGFVGYDGNINVTQNIQLERIVLEAEAQTFSISGSVNVGATVTLYAGTVQLTQVTADADGRYSIESVGTGEYTLEVALAGYRSERQAVRVADEDVSCNVELERYYAVSGTTMAGATVQLFDGDTMLAEVVAADGSYAFSEVVSGSYRLRISLDGYETAEATFAVNDSDFTINVPLAPSDATEPGKGLPTWAIAVIVVACVAVVGAGTVGVILFRRKKGK